MTTNMQHYDNLKKVPANALKTIQFGNLKGKSDINPQWRYEALTEEFGPCGVGWKYEIVETHTQGSRKRQFRHIEWYLLKLIYTSKRARNGLHRYQLMAGTSLLLKDKNGIHGNDEAYKMATTDAPWDGCQNDWRCCRHLQGIGE